MKLDLKEWINKVCEFIKLNKVVTVTKTGRTNGNGALSVSDVVPITASIISVRCSGAVNGLPIPWVYDNGTWYVSIADWRNMSMTAYANTNVTLTIKYVVGGVVRKLLKALKPLTLGRGWAV